MTHMLQVVAQAQYALELDSPVPLGFFLNEEAPEHLVPEINGLSRDRPQNSLGACAIPFKNIPVNTPRDISACKHPLTLFLIRKNTTSKGSCFQHDILSAAMKFIEAPWTEYQSIVTDVSICSLGCRAFNILSIASVDSSSCCGPQIPKG